MRKRELVLTLFVALSLVLVDALFAQGAQSKTLAQVDKDFVCPESLPDDQARADAVHNFLTAFIAARPEATIKDFAEYRTSLLVSHKCQKTLQSIKQSQQAQNAPPEPPEPKDSSWVAVGRRTLRKGIVIDFFIDKNTMTGTEPDLLRTWIKYRNSKPDDGVVETVVHEQLDCDHHTHAMITLTSYSPNGQIIDHDIGSVEHVVQITPGSILDEILPFACKAFGEKTGKDHQ